MRIAEALILRADHQKRLEQLRARIMRNSKVQEGQKPAEDPNALIEEFEGVASKLAQLIWKINLTNAEAKVQGRTMTQALAERAVLIQRQNMYRDLAQDATVTQSVSTRSEVRFKGTVKVSSVQKKADEVSRDLRELDARVQEANWLIDLAE